MEELNIIHRNTLTQYLYHKATRMLLPISGTFELTPVCNFKCKMCYVRKTAAEVACSPRGIMTLDDWRAIARQAFEAGTLDILLTGGEPLLWPDFWTLYEELIDMGFQIDINTNGSLIDEAALARFRARPPKRINLTLYGASDETYHRLCGVKGVFTRVDRAIRGLKEAGICLKLNCSLTPENAADLDWICTYSKEIGATLSCATYMFPPVRREPGMIGVNERFTPEEAARCLLRYMRLDRGESNYRRFLHQLMDGTAEPPGLDEGCFDPADGKVRCRAGRASYWITWDGWMTPCGMMSEPKRDVKDLGFAEAWRLITEDTRALQLSGVCNGCPNRDFCHPCAAIAMAETGSCDGIPTYMCRVMQSMLRMAREELSSEST